MWKIHNIFLQLQDQKERRAEIRIPEERSRTSERKAEIGTRRNYPQEVENNLNLLKQQSAVIMDEEDEEDNMSLSVTTDNRKNRTRRNVDNLNSHDNDNERENADIRTPVPANSVPIPTPYYPSYIQQQHVEDSLFLLILRQKQ